MTQSSGAISAELYPKIVAAIFALSAVCHAAAQLPKLSSFKKPASQSELSFLAQGEPETIPPDVSKSDPERSRYRLNSFADCMVEHDAKDVWLMINNPSRPDNGKFVFSNYANPCTYRIASLQFKWPLLRGSFFRALYRQNTSQYADTLSSASIDYSKDAESELPGREQYVAINNFSECVVRADPKNIRSLILSRTATTQEQSFIKRLSPALSACLAKGSQLSFSKSVLLGHIAEVIYRLSINKSSDQTATP